MIYFNCLLDVLVTAFIHGAIGCSAVSDCDIP